MSATTFLLILAGVVIIFAGYMIKSWFELSSTTQSRRRKDPQSDDTGSL